MMHRCLGCMEEYKEEYDVCPFCGYEKGTPPKEAYHMLPGTLLAERYIVGQVLGFGGFGVTYIGWDKVLARKVAIKEYLPSEFSTRIPGQTEVTTYAGERQEQFESGLGKFIEEAKMLGQFQAANGVVQIYNSFKENATAYIVMEYLEGKTLKTYLEEKGRLSVDEAKEILHPVLIALKEVHKLGILHRDIAPDNIFLANDGRVKLLDFGASRFATTSHSKSLSVIIKPGYAPVEQYRSRGDQGTWTDVYSLAATLYKMITGVTPEDAMERVEKEELKKPSKLGIEIPKNVENAIMNALNIKIEDRTQNVEKLEEELYHADKVKLRFVHLKKADVGKWPLWVKLATSAAALGVVIFAGLLGTGVIKYYRLIPEGFKLPEGMTRVPNFVNNDTSTAEDMADEAELYFQIVDKQYSEYIPADMVLVQNMDKGKIVDTNEIVEVVVSGGLEVLIMPDITGMSRNDGLQILNRMGIKAEFEEVYSSLAKDEIVAQSIAAGTQTYRGDTVKLQISKGYDTYLDENSEVEVPDLTGMTMKEAQKEVEKYGLYIKKAGTKPGKQSKGCITDQSPKAREIAHPGDTIEVYLIEEDMIIYMPDVQYKDEVEAIAELESLGLKVESTYEESSSVAAGKVISQNIAPFTEVKSGTTVKLVVSLGNDEVNQVMAQWSDWVKELPAGVVPNDYEIETKKQYSFRDKSKTTSSNNSMPGWTLYDTTTKKGEFGEWSEWSTTQPETAADREINSKTQYASSKYETQQSEQSAISGWKKIKAETKYRNEYGAWSDWSTTAQTNSDIRKVETKAQYRSRTKSWTTANTNTMSGWTLASSTPTETAGAWSDWSETAVSPSESVSQRVEVETQTGTRTVQTGTKTLYHYYKWVAQDGGALAWATSKSYAETLFKNAYGYYKEATKKQYISDAKLTTLGEWGYKAPDGGEWFEDSPFTTTKPVYQDQTYTQYRSRVVSYTYSFWKWGAWSDWADGAKNGDGNTEVEPRTVYRYQDKIPYTLYTFERWTDWTPFSDTPITQTSTLKVKTQNIYQYRDRKTLYTYHFYQWGDWSKYRDEKVESSDDREVQTRVMYRYRAKK